MIYDTNKDSNVNHESPPISPTKKKIIIMITNIMIITTISKYAANNCK